MWKSKQVASKGNNYSVKIQEFYGSHELFLKDRFQCQPDVRCSVVLLRVTFNQWIYFNFIKKFWILVSLTFQMSYILWCFLINAIVFKWDPETPDLSKYLGEYTFALGQVQLNIHNSWKVEAKREENHCDSQALGIGAK